MGLPTEGVKYSAFAVALPDGGLSLDEDSVFVIVDDNISRKVTVAQLLDLVPGYDGYIDDIMIGHNTPSYGRFTSLEASTLKITAGAAAGKVPISDAEGNLTLQTPTNTIVYPSSGIAVSSGSGWSSSVHIGVDIQAYNSNLTTFAGIAPSANAQTLLGHDFSQMRTDLSLVPGTNVQAYNANITILGNSTTGSGSIVLSTSPTINSPKVILKDPSSLIDGDWEGTAITGTVGETVTIGQLLYCKLSSGVWKWFKYDADGTDKLMLPTALSTAGINSGQSRQDASQTER